MRKAYRTTANAARRMSRPLAVLTYFLFLSVAGSGLYFVVGTLIEAAERPVAALLNLGDEPARIAAVETRTVVLEGDSWMQNLRSSFQERDRNGGRRSSLGAPAPVSVPSGNWLGLPLSQPGAATGAGDDDVLRKSGNGRTYRTMCVRLCDGYFFPVSYSTTSDRFDDDQQTCERSCSSPARLYVYKNPGEEPQDMESLKGQPYTKLSTAFQFRNKIDLACKCGPHPWEEEAMARHRRYAQDEARRKVSRQAELDTRTGKARGKEAAASAEPPGKAKTGNSAAIRPAAARQPVVAQVGPHRVALLNATQPTLSDATPAADKPAPRNNRR